MAQAEVLDHLAVKQREPAREEFAEDHPLRKPRQLAEAGALRERIDGCPHPLAIARIERGEPVAEHHPIDLAAIMGRAGLAQREKLGCIIAWPRHAIIFALHLADEIEIHKAVVDRGDDRIGAGKGGAGKCRFAPRCVDDKEVYPRCLLQPQCQLGRRIGPFGNGNMVRRRQHHPATGCKGGAVFQIARGTALGCIKVDKCGAEAGQRQRHANMDSGGGFAGAAFFIAQGNDVQAPRSGGGGGGFGCRLDLHARPLWHTGPPIAKAWPQGGPTGDTGLSTPSQGLTIVRTPAALTAAVEAWKRSGARVAFVPTMGALHAGHLALVAEGLARADIVAASIFVNPRQFGQGEDLSRYPRDEAGDAAKLVASGCRLLYAPDVATMYPPGFASHVRVAGLPDVLCGAVRPGHFDGVATVVVKLLAAAHADVAIFGEKDWQQLAIVRRIAADLDLGTEIVGAPIVRDIDGLALSSRNLYLAPDDRARALALPRALATARDELRAGVPVAKLLAQGMVTLAEAGFARVDYFELVDGETLDLLDHVRPGARLMAAGTVSTTRLIDNMPV